MASGKSTVAAHLRARGVPIIDADELAREVVLPGTEGLRTVIDAFGSELLLEDGSLDRRAVAALVFSDEAKRRKLNAIMHPRIGSLGAERLIGYVEEPLVGYEASLLIENGLHEAFRPLVVVAAPEAVQIARAMARDGCSESEVIARLRAQKPLAEKITVADYVIDASGSLAETIARTDEVLATLLATLTPLR
jgi:dephospho-CoA kinase